MLFLKQNIQNPVKQSALMLVLLITTSTLLTAVSAQAQTFTSGSTGADGVLDFSTLPAGSVVVFDPKKFNPPLNPAGDNIFNFTTINIPAGITVRLSGRVLTGPVFWLASGDVTINGKIDLNGENGPSFTPTLSGRTRAMPGAGGFSGGVGGKFDNTSPSPGTPLAQPGDGPRGGAAANTTLPPSCGAAVNGGGGSFSGNSFLVPLVGGSGGGGGNEAAAPGGLAAVPFASGGGAGGGAILIASSTSVTVNGSITANGGLSGPPIAFNCNSGAQPIASGGGGGGGAIRLAAPLVAGTGSLSALGGGGQGFAGGSGAIRIESFTDRFTGTFSGTPFTLASPFSTFLPPTPPPTITVAALNGVNVAQPPTGNLATPDATINTLSPVQLTIQASFIPPGTVITLHVFSDNNTDQTVQTTPLLGTLQSSTATANVTFPSGFSLNFVKATWTQ